MVLTLNTSGSTADPKCITHQNILHHAQRCVDEVNLTSSDIVLDVFPSNVIAHYTITAVPALIAGAHLVSMMFDPYQYIKTFNQYQPTYISLIPRHITILEKTKEWANLDMSSVRYMVTGSQPVPQQMIDMLLSKGVKLVANWYGMTEFPPPVMIGYNSECFETISNHYAVTFAQDGECIINGAPTGDIFDTTRNLFLYRKNGNQNLTWKTK
jgi:acyl-coenzyme A synthetase/AMP-(fatty) acid ligase